MPNAFEGMIPTAQRRKRVMELRRKGVSPDDIAERLLEKWGGKHLPSGWDHRYVQKDIKRECDRWRKECRETRKEYVELELQRLDDLLNRLYKELENNFKNSIVDRIIRIMERRAKYLGLDDPDKIAFTDPDGEEIGFSWADPNEAPEWKGNKEEGKKLQSSDSHTNGTPDADRD